MGSWTSIDDKTTEKIGTISNGKLNQKKMLGTSTRNNARSSFLAQNLQEETNCSILGALRVTDLGLRPIFLQVIIKAHCAQRIWF